ncbi:MAG: hypothetical protein JJ901_03485 [Erythrobacter sp.]|uniref:hypothetical protein n=1 Tax=Erythrobacter sp. TaxID=1042 RepID=UPI001B05D701|nr:hypothetical protein [Erythrobacter sp.]MBO6767352.1 hypothetical protein [Erythrobacter sp.]
MTEEMISEFQQSLDPAARLAVLADPVPEHWQAYLSSDASHAQAAFRRELASIAPYLPEPAAALEPYIKNGCLVVSSTYRLCRLVLLDAGETLHVVWSRAPSLWSDARRAAAWTKLDRTAPEQYLWIMRNVMDGLTDLYGFGGPLNSGFVATVERKIDTFAEAVWFDTLAAEHDPRDLVLTLSSGGGAYLAYDVSGKLGTGVEAKALLLDVKSHERPQAVPFLSYLDAWTQIGLGAAELK